MTTPSLRPSSEIKHQQPPLPRRPTNRAARHSPSAQPQRPRASPAKRLAPTTARPYAFPNSSAEAPLGVFAGLDEPSPSPLKTAGPVDEDPAPVAAAVVVLKVAVTLVGFWAPQGWSSRQLLEHALSEPQALTHWVPHAWQVWKGSVREYSDMLGWRPSLQTQPYVRVSWIWSAWRRESLVPIVTYRVASVAEDRRGRGLRADDGAVAQLVVAPKP